MEAPTIDAPTTDAPAAKELAQRVHDDGFVALEAAAFRPSEDVTRSVREQVLRRFTSFLATAEAEQIDLALPANAERLAGFYVREGGRIDMQLSTTAVQTKAVDFVVEAVDLKPLRTLADKWRPVLDELFSPDEYALEYIGCVLSRPGDDDQNWHLDGVHRNLTKHEPADRINVFVPLVAITDATGGTEMKKRSHIRRNGENGAKFEAYADLESVTHCVDAGTPVVMDYRVWHRGLANTSKDTIRPLLYFKHNKREHAKRPAVVEVSGSGGVPVKKHKRITPMTIK